MSRAYCLTCNQQVHPSPSGTCPQGHPVTANDHGPEPWVGFAAVEETSWPTTAELDERPDDVPMERLDAAGRQVAHAGTHANGHSNGQVNGHSNGHGLPGTLLDDLGDHGHAPSDPSDGHTADDLAALLAEALHQEDAPSAPEPVTTDLPPTDEAATDWDADWDELAGLAAELQLDADHETEDQVAQAPTAPEPPAPAAEAPEVSAPAAEAPAAEAPDLDALLAELTGSGGDDAVAEAPVAQPAPVPPPPPVAPPAPPAPEPAPAADTVPAIEDVPSPAPVDETTSLWDEPPAPVEDEPPAPQVDLNNFTARGSRVGGGSGRSTRWRRTKG